MDVLLSGVDEGRSARAHSGAPRDDRTGRVRPSATTDSSATGDGFGETLGPDLTTIAQRFQRKEILESIIYPSHFISDQYASQRVLANGRTYNGLVVPQDEERVTVLLSDGEKIELARDVIEEISPSRVSAMPEGLLNSLTLEQVAELFAFLEQKRQHEVAAESPPSKR